MENKHPVDAVFEKWLARLGSQAAIARVLNVSASTISRWRKYKAIPDPVFELMDAVVDSYVGSEVDVALLRLIDRNGSKKDLKHYGEYAGLDFD